MNRVGVQNFEPLLSVNYKKKIHDARSTMIDLKEIFYRISCIENQVSRRISGDYGGGETPDPIPNSEVKSSCADGTAALGGGRVGRCRIKFSAC